MHTSVHEIYCAKRNNSKQPQNDVGCTKFTLKLDILKTSSYKNLKKFQVYVRGVSKLTQDITGKL